MTQDETIHTIDDTSLLVSLRYAKEEVKHSRHHSMLVVWVILGLVPSLVYAIAYTINGLDNGSKIALCGIIHITYLILCKMWTKGKQ